VTRSYLPGCSRVAPCSLLQISLGRDLLKKSIARAYTGLHAYTRRELKSTEKRDGCPVSDTLEQGRMGMLKT
jgi:hypothetical protein